MQEKKLKISVSAHLYGQLSLLVDSPQAACRVSLKCYQQVWRRPRDLDDRRHNKADVGLIGPNRR